jgi:hypothetical protein
MIKAAIERHRKVPLMPSKVTMTETQIAQALRGNVCHTQLLSGRSSYS